MEVASKFKTKIEWKEKHHASYVAAHKYIWIDQCSKHMEVIRNSNHFWTLEKCKLDAKKYHTKIEWRKNSKKSYAAAEKEGWINECSKHMKVLGSLTKRAIYAFEFSDKSVYVGLTFNLDKRADEHLKHNSEFKTSVFKYKEESGLEPKFVELTKYIDYDVASKKEGE